MKTAAFKSTDIGPIPEDWETKRFDEVYSFAAAGDLQKDFFSPFHDDDHRYAIFSNGLTNMGLYGYTSRPRYKGDSVTITGRGTLGHAEYRKDDFDAIIRLLILTPIEAIDNRFVVYWINLSNPFTNESTSIPQLTVPQVACATLPLPPLPEQRRIAAALSDADELVASLDKLIEKKKRVKEGAMQRLLSGETRLPGFTGKWVEKSVEEIIDKISTGLNPRQNFVLNNGGSNYYVTIKDFKDGELDFSGCDKIDDAALQLINARSDLRVGDILFSSIGRIGDAYVVKETPTNWNVNESVFVLHPANGFDSMFLYYLIKSEAFQKDLKESSTGTTMTGIKVGHLEKIVCTLPIDCEEQCSIAAVLSDMDAEIAALSRERAEAERIKQGMMQELLTGKVKLG